jgi:hypothetical protein
MLTGGSRGHGALTSIGSVGKPFPEGSNVGLDKSEGVFLDLDDTSVKVRFVLDKEGLQKVVVNIGRTLV